MLSYTHFTLSERKYLQELLADGYGIRKAAAALGRSPSSVSREIARNRSKHPNKPSDNKYNYHHWNANNKAIHRRRQKAPSRLKKGSPEWNYIVENLRRYWTPEAIANRWKLDHPEAKAFGFTTIYRYIKAKAFPGIRAKTHLRRKGKRKKPKNANFNTIHPDRLIAEWPDQIKQRLRIGDIEGDTVYGAVGKGFIFTGVDRKSRYLVAARIMSRKPEDTHAAMLKALKDFPVTSISLDNGSEFASFRQLEADLGVPVYFAAPHAPWQRGTNENTNGLIRFFFPKGCDFRAVSDEDLQHVVSLLNNRPRKCLGWKSPAEVFAKSVALA